MITWDTEITRENFLAAACSIDLFRIYVEALNERLQAIGDFQVVFGMPNCIGPSLGLYTQGHNYGKWVTKTPFDKAYIGDYNLRTASWTSKELDYPTGDTLVISESIKVGKGPDIFKTYFTQTSFQANSGSFGDDILTINESVKVEKQHLDMVFTIRETTAINSRLLTGWAHLQAKIIEIAGYFVKHLEVDGSIVESFEGKKQVWSWAVSSNRVAYGSIAGWPDPSSDFYINYGPNYAINGNFFTRKYQREISSLGAAGVNGQLARYIHDGFVYKREGGAWKQTNLADPDILETTGAIAVGDYFGEWIVNDIKKALKLLIWTFGYYTNFSQPDKILFEQGKRYYMGTVGLQTYQSTIETPHRYPIGTTSFTISNISGSPILGADDGYTTTGLIDGYIPIRVKSYSSGTLTLTTGVPYAFSSGASVSITRTVVVSGGGSTFNTSAKVNYAGVAPAGSKDIYLETPGGFNIGDDVTITGPGHLGTGSAIATIDGGKITLTDPLLINIPDGDTAKVFSVNTYYPSPTQYLWHINSDVYNSIIIQPGSANIKQVISTCNDGFSVILLPPDPTGLWGPSPKPSADMAGNNFRTHNGNEGVTRDIDFYSAETEYGDISYFSVGQFSSDPPKYNIVFLNRISGTTTGQNLDSPTIGATNGVAIIKWIGFKYQ